jgi:hypothetical protein
MFSHYKTQVSLHVTSCGSQCFVCVRDILLKMDADCPPMVGATALAIEAMASGLALNQVRPLVAYTVAYVADKCGEAYDTLY